MKVVNNKIHFRILEDELQPQKTIFNSNANLIKLVEVINVGEKVTIAKKKDILHLYVTNIFSIGDNEGFCSERDIIFINDIPQQGKVHIKNQNKEPMMILSNALVINSNSDDIDKDDKVFYKSGQSMILPDHTEIVSETQIYYKER